MKRDAGDRQPAREETMTAPPAPVHKSHKSQRHTINTANVNKTRTPDKHDPYEPPARRTTPASTHTHTATHNTNDQNVQKGTNRATDLALIGAASESTGRTARKNQAQAQKNPP